jgi:hypothetical protein
MGEPDHQLAGALDYIIRLHGRSFFAGGHGCGFCASAAAESGDLEQSFGDLPRGYKDTFIATKAGDAYFAVPELITHYMLEHRYAPPAELREALVWPQPLDLTH